MLERAAVEQGTKVTFVLNDALDAPVSVVGDFNSWKPGAHAFRPRADGTHAVSAVLPKGQLAAFRYLADGGHWFDDEAADVVDTDVVGTRDLAADATVTPVAFSTKDIPLTLSPVVAKAQRF